MGLERPIGRNKCFLQSLCRRRTCLVRTCETLRRLRKLYIQTVSSILEFIVLISLIDLSGTLDIKEHYGYLSTKPDSPRADFDSVMWIASCTKLVTSVAAMQIVEQGLVDLDEDISRVLTEWKNPEILEGFEEGTGKPILRRAKNKITLRQLLTHSSGMGYGIMDPRFQQYVNYMKTPSGGKSLVHHSLLPLMFEPGEGWLYGFSIDWAGAVVERLSGCASLGEYFAKHIWGPLGFTEEDWTFQPQKWQADKPRVALQARAPDGRLQEVEGLPLPQTGLYDGTGEYDGGGGGLFMKPTAYMKLLESLLLNNEVLLKKETRNKMFEPQLKDNKHLLAVIAFAEKNKVGDEVPAGRTTQYNYGLGGMLLMEDIEGLGRSGTLVWGGMPCQAWWIDPSSQLTVFWATQQLPPAELEMVKYMTKFERAVYEELKQKQKL
ncbi:beta-lactamase/transpeptidase-like protein [Dendrothele bispora CBS 962.96]|uniref:Beta-lactamase/transpeptidase-like protein n=1 Tax=Dendrothele bispora (strain CBS 962.96) TaxID=1314807 RepID=A0A4S8KWP5_DENBC|nr:beta-lactamase/transpeptidase-like protein [Dendrothele bispora CBS 962.96]